MVYEPGRVCEICGCESPRVAVCGACEADARAGEANAAIAAEIERLRAMVPSEEEREALSLVVDTMMCAISAGERRAIEAVRVYLRRLTAAKEADRG